LLNSISKYAARVIDSIEAYCEKYGTPPKLLSFSFAALIVLYQSGKIEGNIIIIEHKGEQINIQDDAKSLAFFAGLWRDYAAGRINVQTLTHTVLSNQTLWGKDMATLCGLNDKVAGNVKDILTYGWIDAVNNITL
jgi:tagaturonate reductase